MTPDVWSAIGSVTQAIATVVAVLIALAAAKYASGQVTQARAQVDEARRSREAQAEQVRQGGVDQTEREQRLRDEQARPFVSVDFESSPAWMNAINIVVENIGKTIAKNVRITFDPAIQSSYLDSDNYEIGSSTLLARGVPAMPPGKRIVTLFDLSHERIKTDLPMTYNVRVELQDFRGRDQEPLEYILDLSYRYTMQQVGVDNIHDISQTLKKIERNIGRWTQRDGLRVWIRDEDERIRRERAHFEEDESGRQDVVGPEAE